MNQKLLRQKALALLDEPREQREIPHMRVNTALRISAITVGHQHYLTPAFLNGGKIIYLIIPKLATLDFNGTYESPVFQTPYCDGSIPLWQEFREAFEKQWNIETGHVFFGTWIEQNDKGGDFKISNQIDETTDWCLIKRDINDYGEVHLTSKDRTHYQEMLHEIRLRRAVAVVKDRENRRRSRACRKEAIISLNANYNNEFETFTFGEETFRFRQFFNEFLYTPEGLKDFDRCYAKIYKPYRLDEIFAAEWEKKQASINAKIFANDRLHGNLIRESVGSFKITPRQDGCVVDNDFIDDRTGRQFHKTIPSQDDTVILNTVVKELGRVFERKNQLHCASEHLQSLAVKY